MYIIIEKRDKCIYPKISVLTVLLSNCPPHPAQKDYFPTRPFIPTRNSSYTSAVVFPLSQIHTRAQNLPLAGVA